jgi:putative ABC transport system permease protein
LIRNLGHDVRRSFRALYRNPVMAAISVITLAVGIGPNTAIFSAVDQILLRPLAFADPSQLVRISFRRKFSASGVTGVMSLSPDDFDQVRAESSEFAQIAAYRGEKLTFTSVDGPQKVIGSEVSGDFFPLLGVQPLLGRPILPSDTEPGHNQVVVLSYAFWRDDFGASPRIIGQQAELDGGMYEIVGVMPRQFTLGTGDESVWVPMLPTNAASGVAIIARLRKGISIQQSNAALSLLTAALARDDPKIFRRGRLVASRVTLETGHLANALLILLSAVGFVLMIACANVSTLILSANTERQREVAIRVSLGATRSSIVRQFLIESLVLAFAGGAVGLLLSIWGLHVLKAIAPAGTPRLNQVGLDGSVLSFTAEVSLITGILFGLVPALQISRPCVGRGNNALSSSIAELSAKSSHVFRDAMVVLEVALALILVVGASLLARSFERLTAANLGFRAHNILTLSIDFSKGLCDPQDGKMLAQCQVALETVMWRVGALPGVEAVAAASDIPLHWPDSVLALQIEGQTNTIGIEHGSLILSRVVSPNYFSAIGIPLLRGRDIGTEDTVGSTRVAVVNQAFAKAFLPDNPLGSRISHATDKDGHPIWLEIIGEVHDSRDLGVIHEPAPEFYVPFAQADSFPGANLIVHTASDPTLIATAVRKRIWSVDKDAPITALKTVQQIVAEQIAQPRFSTALLGGFSVLGLLLAVVGIYGVVSCAVTRRTREIGVRIALGARQRDVFRMIIREGMLPVCLGLVAGIAGGLALTRFVRSLLFEIQPTDVSTFAGVTFLIAIVALAACYIPARRAMKVDPMVALRYE